MLFDTLSYVKMMKEVGFDQRKSEAIVGIWSEIVKVDLATKTDLKLLEQRMIIKLGGMQVASIALVVALFKLLKL